jgi:methionyl-tRNA formyltransferase
MNTPRFAFFGTPEFSAIILDELERAGYLPSLIVTAPDKPRGRGLVMTPSEVRAWGVAHNIPVITPLTLKDESVADTLRDAKCDLFIVAAYGKIIPRGVLGIPAHGVLNVHPSLLPKFRGASPIESAILSDESHTGVTIMLLDEEMDHGPIITQREYHNDMGLRKMDAPQGVFPNSSTRRLDGILGQIRDTGKAAKEAYSDTVTEAQGPRNEEVRHFRKSHDWPPKGSILTRDLAHFGGALLAEIIPEWIGGLKAGPQDHTRATYTKKITKEDGLIDLAGDPLQNYRKIRAYDEWPGAYFFTERNGKNMRVRITDATYKEGKLTITRVVPEGKKEMSYEDFLRGGQL